MKRILLGLIACITSAIMAVDSLACSCGPRLPVKEAFTEADVVFAGRCVSGRLVSREVEGIGTIEARKFTFEVEQAWKGIIGAKEVVIETGLGGSDCGFSFDVGFSFVVYAFGEEGRLSTSHCTRTQSLGVLAGKSLLFHGAVEVETRPEIDELDMAARLPKRKWPEPVSVPGLEPISGAK